MSKLSITKICGKQYQKWLKSDQNRIKISDKTCPFDNPCIHEIHESILLKYIIATLTNYVSYTKSNTAQFYTVYHFRFYQRIPKYLYFSKGTLLQVLVRYLSMWQLCGMVWSLTAKGPTKGELNRPRKNTWDNWPPIEPP